MLWWKREATSSIVSTHQRVTSLNRRLTSDLSESVTATVSSVMNNVRRKKKGEDSKKAKRRSELDHSELITEIQGETDCGRHLILSEDEIIPKAWEGMYLLACHGVAPKEWSKAFQEDPTIGSEVKVKAEMC
jgi:hypothetical protein